MNKLQSDMLKMYLLGIGTGFCIACFTINIYISRYYTPKMINIISSIRKCD